VNTEGTKAILSKLSDVEGVEAFELQRQAVENGDVPMYMVGEAAVELNSADERYAATLRRIIRDATDELGRVEAGKHTYGLSHQTLNELAVHGERRERAVARLADAVGTVNYFEKISDQEKEVSESDG